MRRINERFSYTELQLWETSPRSYWQKYGLGEEGFDSEEMSKGSEFMSQLQFGISDDKDPKLLEVVEKVSKLDIFEDRLIAKLPEKYGIDLELVSYIDTSEKNLHVIGEYKTGKIPWTQEMVDKSDQLLFYSTMVWLKTKKVPFCFLEWVQTEVDEYGVLGYTGNVFHFETKFTKIQINGMFGRIAKALIEIDDFVYSEKVLSEDLVSAYVDTKASVDDMTKRLKLLKNEIDNTLYKSKERYGVSSHGVSSVIERNDGVKYVKFSPTKSDKIK